MIHINTLKIKIKKKRNLYKYFQWRNMKYKQMNILSCISPIHATCRNCWPRNKEKSVKNFGYVYKWIWVKPWGPNSERTNPTGHHPTPVQPVCLPFDAKNLMKHYLHAHQSVCLFIHFKNTTLWNFEEEARHPACQPPTAQNQPAANKPTTHWPHFTDWGSHPRTRGETHPHPSLVLRN